MSKLWKDHYKLLAVKKYWYAEGEKNEQERILALVENELSCTCGTPFSHLLDLIKGKLTECECDPCDNENCGCRSQRCDFCKDKD
jgi:hypothetical protein